MVACRPSLFKRPDQLFHSWHQLRSRDSHFSVYIPRIGSSVHPKLHSRQSRFFASPTFVRIGNVERSITDPLLLTDEQRRKIPQGYLSAFSKDPIAQTHLQWLLQKDSLQQDCILVGTVGSDTVRRRRLAMAFAELIQQPVELLTISQDTTESDLKQRRALHHKRRENNEIIQASITFQDQAPVRAAINGHLLIIDGLHRAERNVLPTLNNLLENREMPLEDGRLLVSSDRYSFLQQHQADDPINSSLVPIHPNFRVLALLSHDPNQFRRLDPPVRSRFQIRRVDSVSSDVLYEQLLHAEDEQISSNELTSIRNITSDGVLMDSARELSLFSSLVSANPIKESQAASASPSSSEDFASLLHFPLTSMPSVQRVRNRFPDQPITSLLERVYPYATSEARLSYAMKKWPRAVASSEHFRRVYREMNFVCTLEKDGNNCAYDFLRVETLPNDSHHVQLHFALQNGDGSQLSTVKVTASSGGHFSESILSMSPFVTTAGSKQALTAMLQEHSVGRDILLISPKGEGKNVIAQHFCAVTGYKIHLFPLYKEMTATDLLLRRTTSIHNSDPNRDWMESPLLAAARTGQLCILDGVDKLSRDTLATLQGLLCDREVTLPDGTKYAQSGSCDVKIQSSFRVIALASIGITAKGSSPPTWLGEDVACMFASVPLPPPSRQCIKQILQPHNKLSGSDFDRLLNFHERLFLSAEDLGVSPLSIRTLLRIVKLGNSTGGTSLYDRLCSSLLMDLLQPSQRTALLTILRASRIVGRKGKSEDTELTVEIDEQLNVTIGNLHVKPRKADNLQLVPNPVFVDIPSHVRMLQALLGEWYLGERSFLLLGNQGTGKNKICDRLCTLLNHEREYIQLHRDSTIGQLTITPSFVNGKIVWNDSPLVRAVTYGRALVIDEADKAPLEVIAVLKSLVEDGELLLADGRRMLRSTSDKSTGDIAIHRDFTVWVLANRPGKLFHGNDFFKEVGDCFSAHVVPNPDLKSEVVLLQTYAPSINEDLLRKISASFNELRKLFDNGVIVYPYSTREAVAVAKHLEGYPEDNVVAVLHNVLDLDSYDEHQYRILCDVFTRRGFAFDSYERWKNNLYQSISDGSLQIEYVSADGASVPPPLSSPKIGKWDDKNEEHIGGNQWQGGTGGSDTAGIGGRGGPYRLDRGHKVHQVSDEAKAQVTEEAKATARRIAQKAFSEKLREIGMSENDYKLYSEFLEPIHNDISNLRAALHSVEYKVSDREWVKRQLDGELDDSKLVEGIAGEKHVYKRRGTINPMSSNKLSTIPKRLRFVVDCSGSMYRFNSYDERLNRCLQATALVMESFDGMEDKFEYSIVGHSGDSSCIPLVPFGKIPKNAKERMQILQTMVAHSQFCESGDNTLKAIKEAMLDAVPDVSLTSDESSGSSIVIAISDANLERYGIAPQELSHALQSGPNKSSVKAYCVFIASFDDEAETIKRALPLGRGFVCSTSSELPVIVRNILASEIG